MSSLRFSDIDKVHFNRQFELQPAIRRYASALPASPNVMYIGVGKDDPDSMDPHCAWGPFELAAILEGAGKDYKMVVLDMNEENLRQARERTEIFCSVPTDADTRDETNILWQRYLADTELSGRSEITGRKEYRQAPIPRSFERKKGTGEIVFINGNISTVDLASISPSHLPLQLVHCTNIFIHMRTDEEIISALRNIYNSMSTGGVLITEDKYNRDEVGNTHVRRKLEDSRNKLKMEVRESIPINTGSYASFLIARKVA